MTTSRPSNPPAMRVKASKHNHVTKSAPSFSDLGLVLRCVGVLADFWSSSLQLYAGIPQFPHRNMRTPVQSFSALFVSFLAHFLVTANPNPTPASPATRRFPKLRVDDGTPYALNLDAIAAAATRGSLSARLAAARATQQPAQESAPLNTVNFLYHESTASSSTTFRIQLFHRRSQMNPLRRNALRRSLARRRVHPSPGRSLRPSPKRS